MLNSYLQQNIKQIGQFWFIHCPEIVTLYVDDAPSCKLLNDRYMFVKKYRQQALESHDYEQYIFLAERPYRLEAFMHVMRNTNCQFEKLAELLLKVWIDSENPSINKEIWTALFKKFKDSKTFNATKSNLPEQISIWRGGTADGLSWTTSKKVATWFANRFHNDNPEIHQRQIQKSDVICFLEDRDESEIIVLND